MYGSIYLVVKDFDKSLNFYEKIFNKKVNAINGKRFAIFNLDGLNLMDIMILYTQNKKKPKAKNILSMII